MIVDAVILAGGRSSRLGGVPKAGLAVDGRTLLERTLDAVDAIPARAVVVVGEASVIASSAPGRRTLVARESPPYTGPAAGIAAGLDRLARDDAADGTAADLVAVLACDIPGIAEALPLLVAAAEHLGDADGVAALSPDGRHHQLAAVLTASGLAESVRARQGRLENASVRSLVSDLRLTGVPVPAGATDDIDTWNDAERLGVAREERG